MTWDPSIRGLGRVQDPDEQPVSVAEAKAHLNLVPEFTDDDALIAAYIRAATEIAEGVNGRRFVTQRWRVTRDGFPACAFDLALAPVASVASLVYDDTNGVERTLVEGTDFVIDNAREPGRLYPAYGKTWPTALGMPGSVRATVVVGFGAASAVPDRYKLAIKVLVADLYQHRESVVTGTIVARLENAARALLGLDRVARAA